MTSGANILIVGAGVCGLAAATRLLERGQAIAICDPSSGPGGLASGFAVGGSSVERFYHHLFASDHHAQAWINEMGLGDKLQFLPASMGVYQDGQMFPFGTASTLLRFKPLGLADRIRLGVRVKRLSAIADYSAFEEVRAIDWLRARASPGELAKFWIPMLVAKFGAEFETISMAWLWARFRARVSTSNGGKERLGYLRGGFQQLSDALAQAVVDRGGEISYGKSVSEIAEHGSGGIVVKTSDGQDAVYSSVIWTPSLQILAKVTTGLDAEYAAKIAKMRYHHALVMVVELEKSALPFYWLNVADPTVPFTVAIEHTRFVEPADYGGKTIIYLGRYLAPEETLWQAPDEEIRETFLRAAAKAFSPQFANPIAAHVFRGHNAQPIIPVGWGRDRPGMETGMPGLIAANMAQIYPWDRGINYSLELGERAARLVLGDAAIH